MTILPFIMLSSALFGAPIGRSYAADPIAVGNDEHRSLPRSLRGAGSTLQGRRLQSTTPSTTSTESSDASPKVRRKLLSKKRYFARYSGPVGRESVLRCAKSIVEDEDDTDYTVFEVDVEIEVEVNAGVEKDRIVPMDSNSYYDYFHYDVSNNENDDDVEGCLASLRNMEDVLDVEEDRPVLLLQDSSVSPSSSVESFENELEDVLWNVKAIQADQVSPGPNKVTVCVVDTGIAIEHPEFSSGVASEHAEGDQGGARIKGRNFESLQLGVSFAGTRLMQWDRDINGHGTYVAGVILEVVNDITPSSTPSSIELFIVSAFDGNDRGYESDVVRAVRTCVGEAKADVINLSLGHAYPSTFTAQLYAAIVEKGGAVMVAAAGNKKEDAEHTHFYPASIPSIISVGAVQEGGTSYLRSIRNDQVEFVAPGHKVLSAGVRWNEDKSDMEYVYERRSGTSAAAPHISGAVALVKSHLPTCSNRQIRYALARTALRSENINGKKDSLEWLSSDVELGDDYDYASDCDSTEGYGTIQVRDALDWLLFQGGCGSWDVKTVSQGGCSTLSGGIIRTESQAVKDTDSESGDDDASANPPHDDNEVSQDKTENIPAELERKEHESNNESIEEDADIASSTTSPEQEIAASDKGMGESQNQKNESTDKVTEEDDGISSSTMTPIQEIVDSDKGMGESQNQKNESTDKVIKEDDDIPSSIMKPVQQITTSDKGMRESQNQRNESTDKVTEEDDDISSSTVMPIHETADSDDGIKISQAADLGPVEESNANHTTLQATTFPIEPSEIVVSDDVTDEPEKKSASPKVGQVTRSLRRVFVLSSNP